MSTIVRTYSMDMSTVVHEERPHEKNINPYSHTTEFISKKIPDQAAVQP
jgi:hypothetical protein